MDHTTNKGTASVWAGEEKLASEGAIITWSGRRAPPAMSSSARRSAPMQGYRRRAS